MRAAAPASQKIQLRSQQSDVAINREETYVKKIQIPWDAMLAKKLSAARRKTARYAAAKTTVHHETKTRKRTRSRIDELGYEPLLPCQLPLINSSRTWRKRHGVGGACPRWK